MDSDKPSNTDEAERRSPASEQSWPKESFAGRFRVQPSGCRSAVQAEAWTL